MAEHVDGPVDVSAFVTGPVAEPDDLLLPVSTFALLGNPGVYDTLILEGAHPRDLVHLHRNPDGTVEATLVVRTL